MKNNNGAAVRKLSARSLKNNRMRNIFAVMAIILTCVLFTTVFSLTSGAMQAAQESTMREVGGRFHAGIKAATAEQYEKVAADPLVKKSSYNILIGRAENVLKRQAELRYMPEESALQDMFITLEQGRMPESYDEIVVDTFVMDELGIPCAVGESIPITFSFQGEEIAQEFVVCGWYQGDRIGRASECFLSERFWMELKGARTDEDFVGWAKEHPEDRDVGLRAGNLFFEDTMRLEEKVRTVIKNAGYEPDTELAYGVNWAYMSSRIEEADPVTGLIIVGAVAVILLTGYLIIYNIFQISVIGDIRFYGLLKTIGTTKRQIRRMIRRQAVMLSAIGIPVGLAMGYGIGKLTLPFVLSINDYGGMDVSLSFNPWILAGGAGFSALTVYLGSRRPGRLAGSVSPVEAVKYAGTDGSGKTFRHRKKKRSGGRKRYGEKRRTGRLVPFFMAWSNLGRNRGTTAVVVAAISLSIVLLDVVMTAVGSFSPDEFLEQRIAGDFLLGNVDITSMSPRSGNIDIEPEFLALADAQDGILKRQELWVRYGTFLLLDDTAKKRLKELDEAQLLRRDLYESEDLDKMLRGEMQMEGCFYGYDEELLSNLKALDGTIDIDKFLTGNYVLLTPMRGKEQLEPTEHIYHPGDTVTVELLTENSTVREIKDAAGETVDVVYENLMPKQYEVMAIVEIPSGMGIGRHSMNRCDVVLPLTDVSCDQAAGGAGRLFAVSYEVSGEEQAAFLEAVSAYTESHEQMGYVDKDSLKRAFEGMVNAMAAIGITLAVVIAFIGILNFINAVITQVISRRREFAMLQSIGMTTNQLRQMLIWEGIGCLVISGGIGFVLGSLLSRIILGALNNVILFFEYRFQILPYAVMLPVLALAAVAVPAAAYGHMRKKSIVERLAEGS